MVYRVPISEIWHLGLCFGLPKAWLSCTLICRGGMLALGVRWVPYFPCIGSGAVERPGSPFLSLLWYTLMVSDAVAFGRDGPLSSTGCSLFLAFQSMGIFELRRKRLMNVVLQMVVNLGLVNKVRLSPLVLQVFCARQYCLYKCLITLW